MAYQDNYLRTAIIELLEGTIGTTRTVSAGVFAYGVFDGQQTPAKQSRAVQQSTGNDPGANRFDVITGPMEVHSASPIMMSADRVQELNVTIQVWRHIGTTVDQVLGLQTRRLVLSVMSSSIDDACIALSWPGNIAQTNAGNSTGVISGLMLGLSGTRPEVSQIEEDWETHLAYATISGRVLLSIQD